MHSRTKEFLAINAKLAKQERIARCYTVIENAGYEGECERRTCFSTAEAAWRWAQRNYGADELEALHVQVRQDRADGTQTYDY